MPSGRAYTRLAARRARRRKRTVRAAGVRGTDQALTREQTALDADTDTLDTPRPGPGGNPAQALTHEQTALDTDADTPDTPRPGPGGNPAQALTREQTPLDTDADTPDTPHSRARAETPLKP
ncbi:hypothetical protein GCM10022285_33200 [Streptomyces tunisiensis]|uniref:Uncharacterized protein n=1 Tax=Streptomyces tunisiensis TaxID=948699 RepID=A0ABP7YLY7_9ACTN